MFLQIAILYRYYRVVGIKQAVITLGQSQIITDDIPLMFHQVKFTLYTLATKRQGVSLLLDRRLRKRPSPDFWHLVQMKRKIKQNETGFFFLKEIILLCCTPQHEKYCARFFYHPFCPRISQMFRNLFWIFLFVSSFSTFIHSLCFWVKRLTDCFKYNCFCISNIWEMNGEDIFCKSTFKFSISLGYLKELNFLQAWKLVGQVLK